MPAQASADTPQLLTTDCSSARQARSASLLLVQAVLEGHRWACDVATLLQMMRLATGA
ncbi:hypothetical protein HaLaN_25227, partial [Haematococcus lacustris]